MHLTCSSMLVLHLTDVQNVFLGILLNLPSDLYVFLSDFLEFFFVCVFGILDLFSKLVDLVDILCFMFLHDTEITRNILMLSSFLVSSCSFSLASFCYLFFLLVMSAFSNSHCLLHYFIVFSQSLATTWCFCLTKPRDAS